MIRPAPVLQAYGIAEQDAVVSPFGTGLINHSWKVQTGGCQYLLQQINHQVFTDPGKIAANIRAIGAYLARVHPDYLFVNVLPTPDGRDMVHIPGLGYFRLFPFMAQAHSIDVVQAPGQAFEAAVQFGRFTRMLAGMDTSLLQPTIPHFHNLGLRYQQFEQALQKGNRQRRAHASALIDALHQWKPLVNRYEAICSNPAFRLRTTHHDTKISNVLFDSNQQGLCVIDLDTVMPGFFISDVGDMMRTYLSPVSEEEPDFSRIEIRDLFYEAIVSGYLQEMRDELSADELDAFFYAGQFMIYMQALRFLTDYLNDDVYYGERYPGHNLVRAENQVVLLRRLCEKEAQLQELCGIKRRA